MRIFISYSHKQSEWVMERLIPCLEAGGAQVLIDRKRFEIGKGVVGQMDHFLDQADKLVLVLSPDYLSSHYCMHEMERGLERDPKFERGIVLPILRLDCSLSTCFGDWNPPLYANLQDDAKSEEWSALLRQCEATQLGTTAPMWLTARDKILEFLNNGHSVNLVTQGGAANWRCLLEHITRDHFKNFAVVNLEDPATTSRHGLLTSISKALGNCTPLEREPHDLENFKAHMNALPRAWVALINFDMVAYRPDYDVNLFAAIRYLIMEERKLVLLVKSRAPFGVLLPPDNPLSFIDMRTVELRSHS